MKNEQKEGFALVLERYLGHSNAGHSELVMPDGSRVVFSGDGFLQIYVPKKKAWTGEGLPPVGTVCELWYSCGEWAPCMVMAHDISMGIPTAVVRHGDHYYTGSSRKTLRPIRTPEQIAAETEEREALEIQKVIAPFFDNPMGAAFALHRAGYRKQVKPCA